MVYSTYQIALHWLSAALILAMALTGLGYTYEWFGDAAIDWHQIGGQLLILFMLGRVVARLRHQPGAGAAHRDPLHWFATLNHAALYLCLIAYVVTGYVAASAFQTPAMILPVDIGFARSPTGELFLDAHFTLKWVLLALIGLHLAGVLRLWVQRAHRPISNMLVPQPKR